MCLILHANTEAVDKRFRLKAWVRSPELTTVVVLKPKISFSEYGHVAYQIKRNEAYHNMQANILPLHTPRLLV